MNTFSPVYLVLLLILSQTGHAEAQQYDRDAAYPDLTPYLQGADQVLRLKVESARRLTAIAANRQVDCGVELSGHAVEVLSGRATEGEVTTRYTGTKVIPVTIGQEYLVFAHEVSVTAKEAQTGQPDAPLRFADIARAACEPLRTGLVASTGELWPVLERWSDEEGETEHWVIPPKDLQVPERTPLIVQEVRVHMLEVNGQRVTRPDWDEFDGLPAMPASFVSFRGAIHLDGLQERLAELLQESTDSR